MTAYSSLIFFAMFMFLAAPLYYIWWKFGSRDRVVKLLALVYTFGAVFLFWLNFI